MAATADEKLAEAVRKYPILYEKSLNDFKDKVKNRLAWQDVAAEIGLQSGHSNTIKRAQQNKETCKAKKQKLRAK
ncbi:hypothetical protein ACROYT_G035801 [Oculina patagonica]